MQFKTKICDRGEIMLHEQINQDYVTAMKARDTVKSSTLNFLRAQLKNVGIDNLKKGVYYLCFDNQVTEFSK